MFSEFEGDSVPQELVNLSAQVDNVEVTFSLILPTNEPCLMVHKFKLDGSVALTLAGDRAILETARLIDPNTWPAFADQFKTRLAEIKSESKQKELPL